MEWFGSVHNRIEERYNTVPEIGMGVTEYLWSDRLPYTIIEVVNGRKLRIQADDYKIIKGEWYDPTYEFIPNPKGAIIIITKRKNGVWKAQGTGKGSNTFGIGRRDRYYDPHL
jgi:hypothetical protein